MQSSQLCDLRREFIRLQLIDSTFANSSGRQFWWKRYVTLSPRRKKIRVLLSTMGIAALAAGCVGERPSSPVPVSPSQSRAVIERAIPQSVPDRAGWAADMYAGFAALAIRPTHENVCAVVAVIEQESSFRVDPVVPNMGAIAWRKIDTRAEHADIPRAIVHSVLHLKSADGRSYSDRIDSAKTEKELSDIFEDFIGAVPLGRSLFASWNLIRTRGPMQVNVAFAERYAAANHYPYPVKVSIADEVFTRRGSLYFGIAHHLAYPASYDGYLYRFADFNAGQYASRNAALQSAVSIASGMALDPDGALLPHDGDANNPGRTELAVRTLGGRLNISDNAIHSALEQAKTEGFDRTALYQRVFALAERAQGRTLSRALVPRIQLQGPKITRALTTNWYAHRVEDRFERCMGR
jgi:hypothetical protein